jgi:hypothetical protein
VAIVLTRTVCREAWSATNEMDVTTEALAIASLRASSMLWLVAGQVTLP